MIALYWLILLVVLLIIEIITLGLTTIWFAGGALLAFLIALAGGPLWLQVVVFLAASSLLLYFTRPIAVKYINSSRTKTNVEDVVGRQAIVQETIDNLKATGYVTIGGIEWMARTEQNGVVIPKGSEVEVLSVEGVKVIVREQKPEVQTK